MMKLKEKDNNLESAGFWWALEKGWERDTEYANVFTV